MSRLPPPESYLLSRDPLEYQSWKKSFELFIRHKPISGAEKLLYLPRYVVGQARDCIEGYLLEANDASYDDAITRLEQRFGDAFTIANAYRKKLR